MLRMNKPAVVLVLCLMCNTHILQGGRAIKKPKRHCGDLWNYYGHRKNGIYEIDVDGSEPLAPILVECVMENGNDSHEVLTIIHHDAEEPEVVKNNEDPGSYVRNISYFNATEEHLIRLIDRSYSCQQYVKWSCKGAMFRLWSPRNEQSWWVGRNWQNQYYWGGAETDSRTCSCYPYCRETEKIGTCNCDYNESDKLLEDSGLLLDSSRLPVLQLRFGDISAGDEGNHTLGPLICRSEGHKDVFMGYHDVPVSIITPGYPDSYPPPFYRYTWTVGIPTGQIYELVFPEYDIVYMGAYKSVKDCQYLVVVKATKESERNAIINERHGNSPPYYISEGSQTVLNITLTTCNQDSRIRTGKGFKATFRSKDCVGCNAAVGLHNITTFCDERCGIIASKGYPFPHRWHSAPERYEHSWKLQVASDFVIKLTFDDFDIPDSPQLRTCTEERGVLRVYDGELTNGSFLLIGEFCNSNRQGVIYSTQRSMTLVYVTTWQRVGNGRGFHATYDSIRKEDAVIPAQFSELQNVAQGKLARQSSTYETHHASHAVDGIRHATTASGLCAATRAEKDPWWQVDLQKPYFIHGVVIHNRLDAITQKSQTQQLAWPDGKYGLPMPVSGCPSAADFTWYTGVWLHNVTYGDTLNKESERFADGTLLKGSFQKKGPVEFRFCMKTEYASKIIPRQWTPGQYCIYQYDENCPAGFESGYVTLHHKGTLAISNFTRRAVPKGSYTRNSTTMYFCCRKDGSPSVPIRLPTDRPFYLIQYGSICQKVDGMTEIEQFFVFMEEITYKGVRPMMNTNRRTGGTKLFYCYYDVANSLRGFRVLIDNTGIVSSNRQYYDHSNYDKRHKEKGNFQFAYSCADYPVTRAEKEVIHLNCTQRVLGQYLTIQMYDRFDSLQICEIEVFGEEDCGQPLGMASEEIYDDNITISSEEKDSTYNNNVRLNANRGYCLDGEDRNKTIMVVLEDNTTITGISLQGVSHPSGKSFVRRFQLLLSTNGNDWVYEEQPLGRQKIYACEQCEDNKSDNEVRYHLVRGILARYVEVRILDYENKPCLRMEILGCREKVNCEEILTHSPGLVKSPNYPFYYGQDRSCLWTFQPRRGLHVELDFIVYDIAQKEPGLNGTCTDRLLLYPGYNSSEYIESPDGKFFPKKVTSNGAMQIHLKSCFRYSISRFRGFYARYRFVDCPGCGFGDFKCSNLHICNATCGRIVSIGYPLHYQRNHRCRWLIRVDSSYYINVTFHDFDIIGGDMCNYDYISFYDSETNNPRSLIGKFCNDAKPPKYLVSSWNVLLIEFSSDSEQLGRGFSLSYYAKKFQLPKDMVVSNAREEAEKYHCSSGSMYYNGYCYAKFTKHKALQWYDAEQHCVNDAKPRKGHLVSFLDAKEIAAVHYFLTEKWNAKGKTFYIGLNDVAREGIYKWSDGNPMIFTDWYPPSRGLPTQPDGDAYQDCTMLRVDSIHSTRHWHDIPCSLGDLPFHEVPEIDWGTGDTREIVSSVYSYICKTEVASSNPDMKRKVMHTDIEATARPPKNVSTERYFVCRNNEIISTFFKCDGNEDCRDGSDEEDCGPQCKENGFLCSNLRCVSIDAYCDFKDNCGDGSDELRCVHRDCNDDEYQCKNGQCIPLAQRCDLLHDCHDKSDEENCGGYCNPNTFPCYDGSCIPRYTLCDGFRDCPGEYLEDETFGCTSSVDKEGAEEERRKCSKIPRATCGDLYLYDGIREDGKYTIDPDGDEGPMLPFEVYCKMSEDSGEVTTVIHHDSEEEIYVRSDSEGRGYYRRTIVYDVGMKEIRALISASQQCRQYISWRCTGTGFHFKREKPVSWWVSYDGMPQYYWGGAKNNHSCACNDSCFRQDLPCNCDSVSPNQTNEDAGYLREKTKLPVHEVRFGNTFGWGRYGYHKLGPLECTVSVPSRETNCTNETNYILCRTGHYVHIKHLCLYEFDQYGYHVGCRDVTHLRDCEKFKCPKDYIKCPSSYCIPSRYVCDGKWDCISGSDEEDCDSYNCIGQYKCYDRSSCIPRHQLCDGIRHCPEGDDEMLCDLICSENCTCIGLYAECIGQDLVSLPGKLSPKIRKLDFRSNRLDIEKANFSEYHSLAELILQDNDITVLPAKKFFSLRNLYKLDLRRNKIMVISTSAFEGLRNLKLLHLEHNNIAVIEAEGFYGLSSLLSLNLTATDLAILRRNTFWGMARLKTLNISGNKIAHVEDGAFLGLHSVKMLDIHDNRIKEFSHNMFVGLKSLDYLYTDDFKFCCVAANYVPNCRPTADEISSCEDLISSILQRSFLWVIGLIALSGNLFVVIWRFKTGDLNRVSSLLIISLGFADLLMGIYLLIIASVDVHYRGHYIENSDHWRKSTLCNICGFLSTVSSEVSVFTLVLITIDRVMSVSFSCTFHRFTIHLTYKLIALSWTIAVFLAILPLVISPYFQGEFYARSGVCLALHITNQKPAGWQYSVAIFFCINFAAFLAISSGYLYMYLSIRKSYRKINRLNARQTRENKVGRQMALIVSTNTLCWFPIILMGLMAMAGINVTGEAYAWTAIFLLPINSATNPLIYTISSLSLGSLLNRLPFQRKESKKYSNKAPAASSRMVNGHKLREGLKDRPFKPPHNYVTLLHFLRSNKSLKPRTLLEIATSIAAVLKELHADCYALGGLTMDAVFVHVEEGSGKIHVYVPDFNAYKIPSSSTNDYINETAADMEEFGLLLKKMLRIYHVTTHSKDPDQGTAC